MHRLVPLISAAALTMAVGCKPSAPAPSRQGTPAHPSGPVPGPSGRAFSPAGASDAAPASTIRATVSDLGADTSEVAFPVGGVLIHATLHDPAPTQPRPVVVLAHQLCSDRSEWSAAGHNWVAAFAQRGIATLAIDLRGHGASTAWPKGVKHDLCAQRNDPKAVPLFAGMVNDVEAAVVWARGPGKATQVALVGASVGANSVLVAFGDDPKVRAVVALSPGLDYFHIKPAAALKRAAGRPAVLVAAKDDPHSAASVATMKRQSPAVRAMVFDHGGHGNKIVAAHPELLSQLVDLVAGSLGPHP